MSPGIAPSRRHDVASVYFLPAERSLAPTHVSSNHGWFCRNFTKCWPTIPVAPSTPTSIFWFMGYSIRNRCCAASEPAYQLLINLHRLQEFLLRYSLLTRMRHVDRARTHQVGLAP